MIRRLVNMVRRNRPPQEPDPPPDKEATDDEAHALRMSLFEHLGELRDRLVRIGIALLIGVIIGFIFAQQGLLILRQPFCNIFENPAECPQWQILDPTGNVLVYLRVALLIGGIFAIPAITYQVMMFILPGLTRREKRMVFMSIPAITGLFVIGVVFTWTFLLPPALGFLNDFLSDLFSPEWTADGYLSFVTALIFWMGVAFETPLVFFVLSLLGVVRAKTLISNWRIAVIGSAVAAAFITPTIDPVNMFLVMGPLLSLYTLSILLVSLGSRINGISAPS